jgi:phosphatidylserine/phosphatidylglycerophosphate/cardiolipin synthase-like enzyme
MNYIPLFRTLLFVGCVTFHQVSQAQQKPVYVATWQVYFSPKGGATEAIIEALGHAHSSILVQAYSFTSEPIARALVRAHRRGLRVEILLDKSQQNQRYSVASLLTQASIPTVIDAAHAIAHNKVMIIDDETVITGSFNFTKAAEERNAENVLIIRSKHLAARFLENWRIHCRHSTPNSQPREQK